MSLYDYEVSRKLAAEDVSFAALIMAAVRRADSNNFQMLKVMFPRLLTRSKSAITPQAESWRESKMAKSLPIKPAGGSRVLQNNSRMYKFIQTTCHHDQVWVLCRLCKMQEGLEYIEPERQTVTPEPLYTEWGSGFTVTDRFDLDTGSSFIQTFREAATVLGLDIEGVIVDFRGPSETEMVVHNGAWGEQQRVQLVHPLGGLDLESLVTEYEAALPWIQKGRERKFKRARKIEMKHLFEGSPKWI